MGWRIRIAVNLVVCAAMALVMGACGGRAPLAPTVPPAAGGTITATIDGESYRGTVINVHNSGLRVSITASGEGIGLGLAFDPRLGVSEVGTTTTVLSLVGLPSTGGPQYGIWTAGPSLGSGRISVTALTPTAVSGTFEFVARLFETVGSSASDGPVRIVTDGAFDVTF
jgi:hypothetical protein